MPTEAFEAIAAAAEREGVRLEFVGGRLGVRAAPDGDHSEAVRWLTRYCVRHRPDLWLYAQRGLRVGTCRTGRARPAGALAASGTFAGQGEWADPGQVLMVVEVTSYDGDTDRRLREEKPSAYAQAGIPVYLLIDRCAREALVYSAPESGGYTRLLRRRLGKPVELPAPVGFSLDTGALKGWVR
ncbi:Uma2 family endonuclease [Streptomyces durbertensis]|uniref:Uma2 family endonuclease n=2 Tax=Streptomyces durbertensis TaxID=2448886 RepID=A0ABR6EHW6_9ACTN|nr:Uma2 family endonuclease [Streptomyces durbertensis]